jgi:hypothetical protein
MPISDHDLTVTIRVNDIDVTVHGIQVYAAIKLIKKWVAEDVAILERWLAKRNVPALEAATKLYELETRADTLAYGQLAGTYQLSRAMETIQDAFGVKGYGASAEAWLAVASTRQVQSIAASIWGLDTHGTIDTGASDTEGPE